MTDALIIAYARNSWWPRLRLWRRDGDEFAREANRFAGLYDQAGLDATVKMYTSKNKYSLRSQTIDDIQDNDGFGTFAAFCHGSWKWLFGTGHQIWNVTELARAILLNCRADEDPTIILYACSCGRGRWVIPWKKRKAIVERTRIYGKDGFAHRLSAELGNLGIRAKVFAHTNGGHTTWNPNLCMVTTNPETRLTTTVYYREYIIENAGRPAWKRFCRLMRHDPTFRFDVPDMKIKDVLDRLDREG